MPTYYTVAEGREFNYPADAVSEKIIKESGGRSQLSEEDRKKVKFKTVTEGQDCSDMPISALAFYLERGWIIEGRVEPFVMEPFVMEPLVMEPVVEEEENHG